MAADALPSKVGVVLFPGFQLLDYAGPLDALNILSNSHTITLSTLSSTLDPVPTQNWVQDNQGSDCSQSIVPTHTFSNAPADLDVLLIPGGLGARGAGSESRMEPVVQFLKEYLSSVKDDGSGFTGKGSKVKWVITVCTGSEILARTGILDGRRATTNKRAFNDVSFDADVKKTHPTVNWIAKARWVVDGPFWTSSGVSAGIDVTFAWMASVFGEETAQYVADRSEYERNVDADNDRYAERWGAV